jgi:signal transduction histidine kinase
VFIVKLKKGDRYSRKQLTILFTGLSMFLFSFFFAIFLSNYLADNGWSMNGYKFEMYGLFGTTIFMGFLAYLIVEYHAFKIKLLGAQALVVSMIILVGSQYFYATNLVSEILTSVTLALSLIFGYILIRSVNRDDERKEQLQAMADKLATANDQLRKLDNAKTEFISIASHQLRTPITAIKGFASLLLEGSYGEVSEGVHGALEKIYSSSERLVSLIEDLLNVSRIESGRMQFEFKKDSVERLIKELYDNFILVAKTKKFYLDVKLPETPLPEIVMDYVKIRELVSNFMDNALKYTEKGGATIKAEIKGEGVVIDDKGFVIEGEKSSFGKMIRITVSDTGIGIPREEIPYLFKKFSRGKDVSRLHVGGTGLGLFVGKAIAEAHHGQVWVESDGAGMGSRFIIEIPIEHVQ